MLKTSLYAIFFALFLLSLGACQQEAQTTEDADTEGGAIEDSLENEVDAEEFERDRQAFSNDFRQRIDQLGSDFEKMADKMDNATDEEIQEWEMRMQRLKLQAETIGDQTSEDWEQFKAEVEQEYEDLMADFNEWTHREGDQGKEPVEDVDQ